MTRTRGGYLCLYLAAGLMLAPAAHAQSRTKPKKDSAPANQKEIDQARQELQKIGARLGELQQAVMSKDKKLKLQADKLRVLMMKTMKRNGTDPESEMKRMETLATKLRGGKLSQEEGTKLVAEFQKRREAMEKAQYLALQDTKVKQAREAFQKKMEAAMIKRDPKAKKLLERYKKLSDRLLDMMGARG